MQGMTVLASNLHGSVRGKHTAEFWCLASHGHQRPEALLPCITHLQCALDHEHPKRHLLVHACIVFDIFSKSVNLLT